MSQALPYDEIKSDKTVKLEDILNKTDDSENRHFVEVDLTYPDNKKEKSEGFPFAPQTKKTILIISRQI